MRNKSRLFFYIVVIFFICQRFILASPSSVSEKKNHYSCERKIHLKEFFATPVKIILINRMEKSNLGLFKLTNTSTKIFNLRFFIDENKLPRYPVTFGNLRLDLERQDKGWQIWGPSSERDYEVEISFKTEEISIKPNESLKFLALLAPIELINHEIDGYAFRLIDFVQNYSRMPNFIISDPYCL